MGVFTVAVRYANEAVIDHVVQAPTFDQAWERFSANEDVVGGVVASISDPENYTIYDLGA
jgi:hypothetical protein